MTKARHAEMTEAEMRDKEEQGECAFCGAALKHIPEGRGTSLGPNHMGPDTFFVSYYSTCMKVKCCRQRSRVIDQRYR